jgi:hypothetical protein
LSTVVWRRELTSIVRGRELAAASVVWRRELATTAVIRRRSDTTTITRRGSSLRRRSDTAAVVWRRLLTTTVVRRGRNTATVIRRRLFTTIVRRRSDTTAIVRGRLLAAATSTTVCGDALAVEFVDHSASRAVRAVSRSLVVYSTTLLIRSRLSQDSAGQGTEDKDRPHAVERVKRKVVERTGL